MISQSDGRSAAELPAADVPAPRERRDPAASVELGRAARQRVPLASHGDWLPADDRPDPVAVLEAEAEDRMPELVPIRYGRMLISPFTFFRGAAAVMATDLAATPASGLVAQLCGDAHLSNFGAFASPERHLVFDINDFDETYPGPWEWDVKRLATAWWWPRGTTASAAGCAPASSKPPWAGTDGRWPSSRGWASWRSGTRTPTSTRSARC